MDAISLAAAATDLSLARTESAVQLAVLKKAMELEANGAIQLIQAAAHVIPNNPPHLGNRIDVSV